MTGKMFILVILICWFPDFCHSINGALPRHNSVACEGGILTFECPRNHIIQIVDFIYGRQSSNICAHKGTQKDLDCVAEHSKSIASSRCNGFQKCDILISNGVFGDPCHGTFKYGKVTYNCIRTHAVESTLYACEGDNLSIQCPTNRKIKIVHFMYGRRSSIICKRWSIHNLNCGSRTAFRTASERCNGKDSCDFPVTNNMFGDPCHGTYKYGEVVYTCI